MKLAFETIQIMVKQIMASAGHGEFLVRIHGIIWHMVYWLSPDKLDIVRMCVCTY